MTKKKNERSVTQEIITKLVLIKKNKELRKLFDLSNDFIIAQNSDAQNILKPKSTDIRIRDNKRKYHIVIENKCFDASLTPRQKILYSNVFADAYRSIKMKENDSEEVIYRKYKLFFIIPNDSSRREFLQKRLGHFNDKEVRSFMKKITTKLKINFVETDQKKNVASVDGIYRAMHFKLKIELYALKYSKVKQVMEKTN